MAHIEARMYGHGSEWLRRSSHARRKVEQNRSKEQGMPAEMNRNGQH